MDNTVHMLQFAMKNVHKNIFLTIFQGGSTHWQHLPYVNLDMHKNRKRITTDVVVSYQGLSAIVSNIIAVDWQSCLQI